MFKYALAQNFVEKNPTELLRINIPDDDEHGVPFSIRDIERLWSHQDSDISQVLLIMCYSGYRIGELKVIKTDLKKCFFFGRLENKDKQRPNRPYTFSHLSDRQKTNKEIRRNNAFVRC